MLGGMKRRWQLLGLLLLVGIVVSALAEPNRILWGLLWGEPFYQGRPTSYWSRAVREYIPEARAGRYRAEQPASWVDSLKLYTYIGQPHYRTVELFPFADVRPAAVPVLIDLLRDDDPLVRTTAARVLGVLGADARAAIPALTELRHDAEPVDWFVGQQDTVGSIAALALWQIEQHVALRAAGQAP
jgi:hypothetical protein